jgi:uncharacterized protein (TIGR03086 family)
MVPRPAARAGRVGDDARMIDLLDALSLADAGFDARLRRVSDAQWHLPTPCAEWDVYRLVNHVVVGGGRYGRLIRGGTREAFIAERQIDALVDGAVAAWSANARTCREAFAEPGALQRTVAFSTGDIPGARLLSIRIVEVAVHTWDLARALGLDESLDPALVAFALSAFAENDLPRGAGGVPFFDEPTRGHVAGDLDRLLRMSGREP